MDRNSGRGCFGDLSWCRVRSEELLLDGREDFVHEEMKSADSTLQSHPPPTCHQLGVEVVKMESHGDEWEGW
jgi:hypothetical protein